MSLTWDLLFHPVDPHLISILQESLWQVLGRILLRCATIAQYLLSNLLLCTGSDPHPVGGIYHQFQCRLQRRHWLTVSVPRLVGGSRLHRRQKETIFATVLLPTPGRKTKFLLLKGLHIIMVNIVVHQVAQAEGIIMDHIRVTPLLAHLLLLSPCPHTIVLAAHRYSLLLLVHEVGLRSEEMEEMEEMAEMAEGMAHMAGLHRVGATHSIRHTMGRRPAIKVMTMVPHMVLHMGIAMNRRRITPADLLRSNIVLHSVPTTAPQRHIPARNAFPHTFQVCLQSCQEERQRLVVWIQLPRSACNN